MNYLAALVLMSGIVSVLSEDCRPGTCKPDQTCCPTNIPTIFGCCEYENAVCCADRTHCCPKDTVCDLDKAACFPKMKELNKPERSNNNFNKLEKRWGGLVEDQRDNLDDDDDERSERRVWCDSTTYCPHGSTCCTSADGSYDCCPYPFASCCPDKFHCCSQGWMCDSTSEYCIEEDGSLASPALKEPAIDVDLSDLE